MGGFVQILTPAGAYYVRPEDVSAIGAERNESNPAWHQQPHIAVRRVYLIGGGWFDMLDEPDNMMKLLKERQ